MPDSTESARTLRHLARFAATGTFVPLLDRFPQLSEVQTDDWDFFVSVATVYAGLFSLDPDHCDFEEIHKAVLEELEADYAEGPSALENLYDHMAGVIGRLSSDDQSVDKLKMWEASIGHWVVGNLFHRQPLESDLELAAAIGLLSVLAVEGWAEQTTQEAP